MRKVETSSPDLVAEFVTLEIASQNYCLDITQVREIRSWQSATSLPHARPETIGVINLRGTVIPVIDLSVILDVVTTGGGGRNVIVIVSIKDQIYGLAVEGVSEIISVRASEIKPAPDALTSGGGSCIKGLIETNGALIRIIDLDMVLSQDMEPVD